MFLNKLLHSIYIAIFNQHDIFRDYFNLLIEFFYRQVKRGFEKSEIWFNIPAQNKPFGRV